jgi:hypothetical protein
LWVQEFSKCAIERLTCTPLSGNVMESLGSSQRCRGRVISTGFTAQGSGARLRAAACRG